MKTIHKYDLTTEFNRIVTHDGVQWLSVNSQDNQMKLWGLVDTDNPPAIHRATVVGTGQPVPDSADSDSYLGTLLLNNGMFVFHVFVDDYIHSEKN